jgi:hypothetical protein
MLRMARYMHASVLSEPDETPDITGVTFVMTPAVLVTVYYHQAGSFEIFGHKLCKSFPQVRSPDAMVVGSYQYGPQPFGRRA